MSGLASVTGTTRLGFMAAALAIVALAPTLSLAQRPAPPVDPKTAAKDLSDAWNGGLDRSAQQAFAKQKAARDQINGLKSKAANAKKKADDAAAAADGARVQAQRCATDEDKAKAEKTIADAEKKLDDAEKAKKDLDDSEKKIRDAAKGAVDDVQKQIDSLNREADAAVKSLKDAGVKETSAAVTDITRNQQKMNDKVSKMNDGGTAEKNFKDNGALDQLRNNAKQVDREIDTAKGNNDPKDAIDEAKRKLQEAKDALKDCPKKTSSIGEPPGPLSPPVKEVFVNVDNRPQNLVCIEPGANVEQVLNTLGITESSTVASTAAGTIVRTPTSLATIAKNAQAANVKSCFPEGFAESDFCVIMTPLTAFRGHDHAAHKHSGRGEHDHDAPDPPLDWGVTPPIPTITLPPGR